MSILMPLLLGIALTYMSYTDVGKAFFIFFIIMFILSFYIKDLPYKNKNTELKKFFKLVKKEKDLKQALLMPFLGGLTYFSGSFLLIITLTKVINFKTNMALGVVESVCAIIALTISIIYSLKIDKNKISSILKAGGIITLLALVLYSLIPSLNTFIIVLLINSSFIALMTLIDTTTGVDISNHPKIKKHYKAEYLLAREIALTTSRCISFTLTLIIVLIWGIESLNYILVALGIIILLQSIVVGNFLQKN